VQILEIVGIVWLLILLSAWPLFRMASLQSRDQEKQEMKDAEARRLIGEVWTPTGF
jgi:hypothetical protein